MKKLALVILGLGNMVCCPQVAPAAVLIQPIQGSTSLYSGVATGPETAVFTMTLSVTAINNPIRIIRTPSGITSLIQGLPTASVVVLSSTLNSTASLLGSGEYEMLAGQTKVFTLTTTVQTLEVGIIYAYFRSLTWRDMPDPVGDVNTVFFANTFQPTPPAEITVPLQVPDPNTSALFIAGLGVIGIRRFRR
jgi:hypothetical protein